MYDCGQQLFGAVFTLKGLGEMVILNGDDIYMIHIHAISPCIAVARDSNDSYPRLDQPACFSHCKSMGRVIGLLLHSTEKDRIIDGA